jgi:hypothetical protein
VNNGKLDLVKLRQGSVIAEGTILTQRELMDPVDAVGRVREALATNNGGKLGGNVVESASVTVESTEISSTLNIIIFKHLDASSNGVALHNESASNFGYIVVGSLVLAILVIVFAVFACIVFGVSSPLFI